MNTTDTAPIESILEAVGQHLAQQAKQAALKNKDLAAMADVSPNTITAVFSGGDFKLSTLIRLSRVLGDSRWLEPLLESPQPTPLEQLQGANSKKTSVFKNQKPAARRMGRRFSED